MIDCIHHTYSPGVNGYGRRTYKGRTELVHRVAYCEHTGRSISDIAGKVVRHKCDNPLCINPEHLELGTQADNVEDMHARNRDRKARGELAGSAVLTEQQVAEIRATYRKYSRESGSPALARKYGVSNRAIIAIVLGQNWRHCD